MVEAAKINGNTTMDTQRTASTETAGKISLDGIDQLVNLMRGDSINDKNPSPIEKLFSSDDETEKVEEARQAEEARRAEEARQAEEAEEKEEAKEEEEARQAKAAKEDNEENQRVEASRIKRKNEEITLLNERAKKQQERSITQA